MIRFRCGCGYLVRASDELAGETGICPGCNRPVPIPTESIPTESQLLPQVDEMRFSEENTLSDREKAIVFWSIWSAVHILAYILLLVFFTPVSSILYVAAAGYVEFLFWYRREILRGSIDLTRWSSSIIKSAATSARRAWLCIAVAIAAMVVGAQVVYFLYLFGAELVGIIPMAIAAGVVTALAIGFIRAIQTPSGLQMIGLLAFFVGIAIAYFHNGLLGSVVLFGGLGLVGLGGIWGAIERRKDGR